MAVYRIKRFANYNKPTSLRGLKKLSKTAFNFDNPSNTKKWMSFKSGRNELFRKGIRPSWLK